jgi:hypothetical protein
MRISRIYDELEREVSKSGFRGSYSVVGGTDFDDGAAV